MKTKHEPGTHEDEPTRHPGDHITHRGGYLSRTRQHAIPTLYNIHCYAHLDHQHPTTRLNINSIMAKDRPLIQPSLRSWQQEASSKNATQHLTATHPAPSQQPSAIHKSFTNGILCKRFHISQQSIGTRLLMTCHRQWLPFRAHGQSLDLVSSSVFVSGEE